eukprot:9235685-Heterocapsa_arctica.AAC.1
MSEIPSTEVNSNKESTDEQTNHIYCNGKEVRKKTLLKANQMQMHKRAITDKARLEQTYVIDKSDTEDNSEVIKHIKIVQNSIDEKNKRDIQ